jgi:hypothetical protein
MAVPNRFVQDSPEELKVVVHRPNRPPDNQLGASLLQGCGRQGVQPGLRKQLEPFLLVAFLVPYGAAGKSRQVYVDRFG